MSKLLSALQGGVLSSLYKSSNLNNCEQPSVSCRTTWVAAVVRDNNWGITKLCLLHPACHHNTGGRGIIIIASSRHGQRCLQARGPQQLCDNIQGIISCHTYDECESSNWLILTDQSGTIMVLMSSWGLYKESVFQEISVIASPSPAKDKRQEQKPPLRKDIQEFFLKDMIHDAVLENVIRDAVTYTELQLTSNISLWETLSN